MPWTDTARREHRRDGTGYPSDLRNCEWELISPMLSAAQSGGRPRKTCLRRVMNAILYVESSGASPAVAWICGPPGNGRAGRKIAADPEPATPPRPIFWREMYIPPRYSIDPRR